MFRTPPKTQERSMNTRSASRKNMKEPLGESSNIVKKVEDEKVELQSHAPRDDMTPSAVNKMTAANFSAKSAKSAKSGSSVKSGVLAKARKILERRAAQEKALIEKRLAADLANLDDSSHQSKDDLMSVSQAEEDARVERWLERSHQELEAPALQRAATPLGGLDQPLPPRPTQSAGASADGTTVHMLAAALKDLAAVATSGGAHANMLSRMSTPRDLPSFSGDPLEWLQFRQAYYDSTKVCKFSEQENLWRLRKCLHGAAKEAVSALFIGAASPADVMQSLELQFGNPDIIIGKIMHDIRKMQPMSLEYHKEIVKFSVKIKNFVAAVLAIGQDEYLKGSSVISVILSKLPTILISKWADYSHLHTNNDSKPKLLLLSEFLEEEAVKISKASVFVFNPNDYRKQGDTKQIHATHAVLITADNKCWCCESGPHKLTECKKFKKALRKERWRIVKRHGVCFKCLTDKHRSENCPAPACDVDGCGGAHHRLLHYVTKNKPQSGQPADATGCERDVGGDAPGEPSSTTTATNSSETVMNVASANKALLKVVPVNVHTPSGGIISATALLDDGSTVSLISSDLAARAGLRGHSETLRVCGAWKGDELLCEAVVVNLRISDVNNSNVHDISVRSVKELNLPRQNLTIVDCNKYPHLLKIKDKLRCCNINCKPDLLIGQDNYQLLLCSNVSLGKRNEPSAALTPLGWCVHGVVRVPRSRALPTPSAACTTLCMFCDCNADAAADEAERHLRDIQEQVRHYFAIDSLGVSAKPRQNLNDVEALAQLEQSAVLVDGKWQVGLPWKDKNCKMPDSYPAALRRLKGVEKKMSANCEYSQRYIERVDHLFSNGYAKPMEDCKSTSSRTWYLPHFGVDNPNKKKLRLVFDAAAKVNGMCLNDYFHKGPDLLVSLFGIMVRFRENRIAVAGDIKDMFLRVKIQPEDQDALRFLWRNHPNQEVGTFAMTSLIFGANCSPFIAQFVKNKNALRFASTMPEAVAAVCEQHYMDDYLDSLPDNETAIQMVKNIINIHKQGNFHICNWASNSTAVLDSVPKELLGSAAAEGYRFDHRVKTGVQQYERTLGLLWFPQDDVLCFDLTLKRIRGDILKGTEIPTKRILLQVVMSIFDVFGFLAPFTIQGKILLQDTWRVNLGWDEKIPDEIFRKWLSWIDLFKVISNVKIPRCYLSCMSVYASSDNARSAVCYEGPKPASLTTTAVTSATTPTMSTFDYNNLQLHVFSDASVKAMCAVAYWRWECDGTAFVAFIASKCRVAPVKLTTVPRLELQAAVLAARLADTIVRESKLRPTRKYFWCDSTTVLHWIGDSTRSYKTFIANRLGEIDELTCSDEWRYVPTKLNIADVATREAYDTQVFETDWLLGPTFLRGAESSWPPHILEPVNIQSEYVNVATDDNNKCHLPIPDPERFSSWLRLKRAACAVLRFIARCRKQTGDVNGDMMERAELLLFKQAQRDSFANEIAALGKHKTIDKSSKLLTLSPILDQNGLLRVSGRIDAAPDVSSETKRPIILDGRHQVTRLLVKRNHVKCAHGNQETVVNNLKEKYWIIKLRPTVKYVASRCMLCRIRKATPKVPVMGNLPAARMEHHHRPFTHCGLDLFGPMEVTEGRRRMKRYGVLFTCLTVRAIHLEVVHSLTTDSLIMALRRMAARRGWPQQLYSDNGTNLRGADSELKKSVKEVNYDSLRDEAINNGTNWNFIPPLSPHWGGAWERLIRSVKTSLKVILKERAPKEEVLMTLLAEVENIVNSRPLSHVSVEPGSSSSLTPNHFLLGSSSNLPVLGSFDDSDLYLRKQWRTAQRLADMFWRRWVREILPEMLPRKKWHQDQTALKVGDLVLLVDPESPRNVWPKAVVQRIFPGKDGRVRVVELKTKSGVLTRSVTRVAPVPLVD